MQLVDVLPKWYWRDARTITSRDVIELLDTVVNRGAPVMANNLAQLLGHTLKQYARNSRFVLPGQHANKPAEPKLITRGVQLLLPRFLAHEIEAFTPHDLRRTRRTTLGRLGVTPIHCRARDQSQ